MEIERKFLIGEIPFSLEGYVCREIEQAYLCTDPVVRVRRDNGDFYLTYKSKGLIVRDEYNLPLTKEAYAHLLAKHDGTVITKKRYEIPDYAGLILAEVEFQSEAQALSYAPPAWFGEDVSNSAEYHNSTLSKKTSSRIPSCAKKQRNNKERKLI